MTYPVLKVPLNPNQPTNQPNNNSSDNNDDNNKEI